MKVIYLKSLQKDLQKIKNKKTLKSLLNIFVKLEESKTLFEISGVIKMVGHADAYRIRVGEYRLGIFYSEEIVTIARFLKRGDIYKLFL